MAPPSIATIANNDSEHDAVDVFRNRNVPRVAADDDAAVLAAVDESAEERNNVLEGCEAAETEVEGVVKEADADAKPEEPQEQWGLPQKQGLYDPENEHDACGVGFIVAIDGKRSHKVQAKQSL